VTAPRTADAAYTFGVLLIVVGGIFGASIGIGGKFAVLGGASPSTIMVGRYLIASAVLWLVLPMTGHAMRLPKELALGFLLIGMGPQMVIAYGIFGSLQYISAGAAVLILFLFPCFVYLASVLLGRDRWTRGRVVAVVGALAGAALVVGGPGPDRLDLIGVGLAFMATAAFTVYVLIIDRLLPRADPLVAAAHMNAGAGAAILVITAIFGGVSLNITPTGYMGILIVTLGGNLVGMLAFFAGMRRVGASLASIGSMLEVVSTVILGALLFSEPLGPIRLLGGALIVGAMWLMQREGRRDRAATAAQIDVEPQALASS
jgi:drug/metabolite transporter (DMT)-like permease